MKIKTNLCAGILCVISAVIIWLIIPFQIGEPASESITSNARLFPQMFTVLIGILGAVLIAMSLIFHKEVVREVSIGQEARVLGYYVLVALFAFLIPITGFLISALLFVTASLAYLKSRNKWHYVAAVLVTAAVYLAFSKGLGVRF